MINEEEIEKVELVSIGGLCEPDLTGSCHVIQITYSNEVVRLLQLEAGFFQRRGSQPKNQQFPDVLQKHKPGCIILSHGHLDHLGRLVPMHIALRDKHELDALPIIMSNDSRRLLPHILNAIHRVHSESAESFEQTVLRFNAKWESFKREYIRKPSEAKMQKKDHRPYGDRMEERREKNRKEIEEFMRSFIEWGGEIKRGELCIPAQIGAKNKGILDQIIRAINELKKPENSGVMVGREGRLFEEMKEELVKLCGTSNVLERLDTLFERDLPRNKRKERAKRVGEAQIIIDAEIKLKHDSLLPEITEGDIDTCIVQSEGRSLQEGFDVPNIPGVQATFYPTGHMLGSVSVELVFQMVGGKISSLLFSGDVGSWEKPTLHGLPVLPQRTADVLMMESTYAGRYHENVEDEKVGILEFVRTHKAPILAPVFSLDRMYVVLHALQEQILRGEINCPIYWRNILGEATLDIYTERYPDLLPILSRVQQLSGKNGGAQAHEIIASREHCLMLVSGGTIMEGSTAFNLLRSRAESGLDVHMLLTGYQPGELGKAIMDFAHSGDDIEAELPIRVGPFETSIIRGNIHTTGVFSGHGDERDLQRFSQAGDRLLLIHGNPKTAPQLAERLGGAEIVKRNTPTPLFPN